MQKIFCAGLDVLLLALRQRYILTLTFMGFPFFWIRFLNVFCFAFEFSHFAVMMRLHYA